VHDDEAQARVVERLLIRARRDRTPLFVADVVLCELAWMLTRRLALGRAEIAVALDRLRTGAGVDLSEFGPSGSVPIADPA